MDRDEIKYAIDLINLAFSEPPEYTIKFDISIEEFNAYNEEYYKRYIDWLERKELAEKVLFND
jgi:hypothetical protein